MSTQTSGNTKKPWLPRSRPQQNAVDTLKTTFTFKHRRHHWLCLYRSSHISCLPKSPSQLGMCAERPIRFSWPWQNAWRMLVSLERSQTQPRRIRAVRPQQQHTAELNRACNYTRTYTIYTTRRHPGFFPGSDETLWSVKMIDPERQWGCAGSFDRNIELFLIFLTIWEDVDVYNIWVNEMKQK